MKKQQIITLTTDFGDEFALSQLKAVLLTEWPEAKVITISNTITPYAISEGAFVIKESGSLFPRGTIHIGVVDPGVGTAREGIVIQTEKYTYVGPNNGIFYPAVEYEKRRVWRINEKLVNKECCITFHGRDVFSKIVASLKNDTSSSLKTLQSLNDLKDVAQEIDAEALIPLRFRKNQILHIDAYGNIKVNVSCDKFKIGKKLTIKTRRGVQEAVFVRTFGDVKPGVLLAYEGSHRTLEIAKNLGNAAHTLKVSIDDELIITQASS